MSVEHGFLSAGSEPGTESTRNRIGMEKYQGLDPPLLGIRDFQVRAGVGGRRSRAQSPPCEPGYQERQQQLQGAELAGGDFPTAGSGNRCDLTANCTKRA